MKYYIYTNIILILYNILLINILCDRDKCIINNNRLSYSLYIDLNTRNNELSKILVLLKKIVQFL